MSEFLFGLLFLFLIEFHIWFTFKMFDNIKEAIDEYKIQNRRESDSQYDG